MKNNIIIKIFTIILIIVLHNLSAKCQLYKSDGTMSIGYFGNSGLSNKNTTIPILIGFEKWKPVSGNIAVGLSEDLSYIQNKVTKSYFIISATKFNLHFGVKNKLDLYTGVAYNYLLINEGDGAKLFDEYIGYHVGAKFFINKTIGLLVETGKGNYVNFGLVFKL